MSDDPRSPDKMRPPDQPSDKPSDKMDEALGRKARDSDDDSANLLDSALISLEKRTGSVLRVHLPEAQAEQDPVVRIEPGVDIDSGGTQKLTVNAGKAHANRSYWIFGSVSGTTPGVSLGSAIGSVHIPLNPDFYTDITIASPNSTFLVQTKGVLNASGQAQASFVVPKITDQNAIEVVFYHAYLVYDANNNFYMASNPVPLKLVK